MTFKRLLFLAVAGFISQALLQPASAQSASSRSTPSASAQAPSAPRYGKYSCTASKYRNGSYEFIPRGSFTITRDGNYTYYGFEKPSTGTFRLEGNGDLLFSGGYFDKGKAEKIDRPNKFFVVFPTIPDNRWTCSLLEEK